MIRPRLLLAGAVMGAAGLAILVGERRRPRRASVVSDRRRLPVNLALGVVSMVTMALTEAPASRAAARLVARRRLGVAQALPLPGWARGALAFLLMDYTTYLWHVLTHEVPLLWRLHLVHHLDRELDASTALRFHAVDMAVSTPFRVAQVLVSGAGPHALEVWRNWFLLAVLFHHSNLKLPGAWDRRLSWLVTTPHMHGVHHSARPELTGSNWSSGLSLWDRLHGTFRNDPDDGAIGVPAYAEPVGLLGSLRLPFGRQRDDWDGTEASPAR